METNDYFNYKLLPVSRNLRVAAAKLPQSCPTLGDLTDGSPPGSPVPGIPQARTLEWVAISFSNAWKWKVKVKSPSRVQLLATPRTAAHQAPPSMGFSRQGYWSGVPLHSPIWGLVASICNFKKKLLLLVIELAFRLLGLSESTLSPTQVAPYSTPSAFNTQFKKLFLF